MSTPAEQAIKQAITSFANRVKAAVAVHVFAMAVIVVIAAVVFDRAGVETVEQVEQEPNDIEHRIKKHGDKTTKLTQDAEMLQQRTTKLQQEYEELRRDKEELRRRSEDLHQESVELREEIQELE